MKKMGHLESAYQMMAQDEKRESEAFEWSEALLPKFQNILRTARQQIQNTGGIAHEDFWDGLETERNSLRYILEF